jgi:hypothetical protein
MIEIMRHALGVGAELCSGRSHWLAGTTMRPITTSLFSIPAEDWMLAI